MGRNVPGDFANRWTPPAYTVDDDGKVVGGYTPPGLNNWGRWGANDQRGTQNLVGPAQIARAAGLVRDGKVFSMALMIDADAPRFPTRPAPQHYFLSTGADAVAGCPVQISMPGYQWNDDMITMALQGSTQWDGFGHFMAHDTMYNGYWAGNVTAAGGAAVLGIDAMYESFIGRGVLLDLARLRGVEWLPEASEVNAAMLDECLAAQGVALETGDIVLLRTGFLQKWERLQTFDERVAYFGDTPGLIEDCVEWLYRNDVSALAADTVGIEVLAPTTPQSRVLPIHHGCLVDLGLPLGEFWDLEALAADCAEDGRYDFMLVAPPLRVPHAVGSPLNPIAMK